MFWERQKQWKILLFSFFVPQNSPVCFPYSKKEVPGTQLSLRHCTLSHLSLVTNISRVIGFYSPLPLSHCALKKQNQTKTQNPDLTLTILTTVVFVINNSGTFFNCLIYLFIFFGSVWCIKQISAVYLRLNDNDFNLLSRTISWLDVLPTTSKHRRF